MKNYISLFEDAIYESEFSDDLTNLFGDSFEEDESKKISDILDQIKDIEYGFIDKNTGERRADREWIHACTNLGDYYQTNFDPEITLKNKLGICLDQSLAIQHLFKKLHPDMPCKIWALMKGRFGHAVPCFCDNDKYYYLENAWDKEKGLWGPFDDEDALRSYLESIYHKHHDKDNDDEVIVIPYEEYEKMNYLEETINYNKIVFKDGSDMEYSDYELYQILENSGFKTTENNLVILKNHINENYFILDNNIIVTKNELVETVALNITNDPSILKEMSHDELQNIAVLLKEASMTFSVNGNSSIGNGSNVGFGNSIVNNSEKSAVSKPEKEPSVVPKTSPAPSTPPTPAPQQQSQPKSAEPKATTTAPKTSTTPSTPTNQQQPQPKPAAPKASAPTKSETSTAPSAPAPQQQSQPKPAESTSAAEASQDSTATPKAPVKKENIFSRIFKKKKKETVSSNANITESYSDYKLYQILEENGFTTTEKNLELLKEGLKSGKYSLED